MGSVLFKAILREAWSKMKSERFGIEGCSLGRAQWQDSGESKVMDKALPFLMASCRTYACCEIIDVSVQLLVISSRMLQVRCKLGSQEHLIQQTVSSPVQQRVNSRTSCAKVREGVH